MTDGRVRRALLGVAVGPRPLPPRVAARLGRRDGLEVIEVVEDGPGRARRAAPRGPHRRPRRRRRSAAADDLQRLMTAERIGRPVELQIVRAGTVQALSVVPAELEG